MYLHANGRTDAEKGNFTHIIIFEVFGSMEKQNFFTQFKLAISSYFKAIELIFDRRMFVYFVYALVISALLVAFELFIANALVESAENYLMNIISPETFWAPLRKILQFVIHLGLHLILYFVFLTINKYLLLIVLSPLMAAISEKTETILTGKTYAFQFSNLIRDLYRGAAIALRNMCIEFGCIFLSLFIIWIPIIGWLCPLFLFILSCYFYGFSMIDYTNERRGLATSHSIVYVKRHKGLAIGNGFILLLLFAIPYIGLFLAAILGPVSATIAVLESEKV